MSSTFLTILGRSKELKRDWSISSRRALGVSFLSIAASIAGDAKEDGEYDENAGGCDEEIFPVLVKPV